jgi:hypothetical protein
MDVAAYTPPSGAESLSFLVVIMLVAILLFVAFMAAIRRSSTHSELVPGDVRRDLHAIVASIDGIPKVHVKNVETAGHTVIRARRNATDVSIRVELRQEEPALMLVTVTIRTSGGKDRLALVPKVMQAIYSAQERLTRGPSPFGPTAPT